MPLLSMTLRQRQAPPPVIGLFYCELLHDLNNFFTEYKTDFFFIQISKAEKLIAELRFLLSQNGKQHRSSKKEKLI
jgi:hypothetical protein